VGLERGTRESELVLDSGFMKYYYKQEAEKSHERARNLQLEG